MLILFLSLCFQVSKVLNFTQPCKEALIHLPYGFRCCFLGLLKFRIFLKTMIHTLHSVLRNIFLKFFTMYNISNSYQLSCH